MESASLLDRVSTLKVSKYKFTSGTWRQQQPAAARRRISFSSLLSARGKWCCALIGCWPLTCAPSCWRTLRAALSAQSALLPVIPDTATCRCCSHKHTRTHSHTYTHTHAHECALRLCAPPASATCNWLHLSEQTGGPDDQTMRAHCIMRYRRLLLLLRSFRR